MKKEITPAEVEKIAKLAHLELSDEEKGDAAQYLGSILEYAERLNEVDTAGVEPYSPAVLELHETRDDRSVSFASKAELLASAELSRGLVKARGVFTERESNSEKKDA